MNVSWPAGNPRPVNVARPAATARPQDQPPPPPKPTEALPKAITSHVWRPLRGASLYVRGFATHLLSFLHKKYEPRDVQAPGARAQESWAAAQQHMGLAPNAGIYRDVARGPQTATVWSYGQVLAAALDMAQMTGDYTQVKNLAKGLSNFEKDGAFAPGPWGGNRLWDDNAWVGLDMLQAYEQTKDPAYLKQAEDLYPFFQQGISKQGGVYWEENNPRMTRNSCANGPTAEYALRLYMITKKPQYLALAKTCDGVLNGPLRSPEGLYYDNLGDDGKLDKAIFSYNQGAALGADVLWFKATGDKKYLERAQQTAKAALDYFGKDDRLWKESPAFNAIFFRNLLALDAVAPDPAYRKALDGYLDRVWKQARDPNSGLFTHGGIGGYTKGKASLLDQSGIAQLFALQAWRKDDLGKVS